MKGGISQQDYEIETGSEIFERKPEVELVKLRDFSQKVQGKRELMYALQVKGM